MRNWLKFGIAFLLFIVGNIANAAPATALIVNPCGPSVVQTCSETIHPLSQAFTFWVVAVDSVGALATNYSGTVNITSSDPSAVLPLAHTFTPADGSVFAFTITLNSLGLNNPPTQSVTATDSLNALSGNHVFFVVSPTAAAAVPISTHTLVLLVALLSILALRTLQLRSVENC